MRVYKFKQGCTCTRARDRQAHRPRILPLKPRYIVRGTAVYMATIYIILLKTHAWHLHALRFYSFRGTYSGQCEGRQPSATPTNDAKRERHALFDGTVWQKGMDLQEEGDIRKGLKVQRHRLFIVQRTSHHRLTNLSCPKGPLSLFPRGPSLRQTTAPTRRCRRQRVRAAPSTRLLSTVDNPRGY
jgi:hypothetical protein